MDESHDPTLPRAAPNEADRLVDALQAEGEHQGEGRFRMDREAAARKLRDYQLPDPIWYLLELVQAAVARGAKQISLRVDADDVELTSDGEPFTAEDLTDREAALFDGDARGAALGCLAVGLHTALGRGPRFIEVKTGDGERGWRLVLRPGEPETLEEKETDLRGFSIHVKSALSGELLTRARQDRKGLLPEEQLLTERCRYAPASILLEGKELARGLALADPLCQMPIEGPGFAGVGGFLPGCYAPAAVHVVQQGVWLETVELGGLPNGYLAVVEARELHKDLSRVRFVRDAGFEALRLAVRRARLESLRELGRLFANTVEAEGKGAAGAVLAVGQREWAGDLLREGLRNFVHRRDFEGSFADDTAVALAGTPLFRLVDEAHPAGRPVSVGALLAASDRGEPMSYALIAATSDEDLEGVLGQVPGPGPGKASLVLRHDGDQRFLAKLLGALEHSAPYEQRLRKAIDKRVRAAKEARSYGRVAGWGAGIAIGFTASIYLLIGLLAGSSGGEPEPSAKRTREVQQLEEACRKNHAESCAKLGRGYEEGQDPFPQSGGQARSYYGLACMWGHDASCQKGKSPAAVFSESMKCAAGSGEACFRLSERYQKADGVVRDLRLAAKHRKEACEKGFAEACRPPARPAAPGPGPVPRADPDRRP